MVRMALQTRVANPANIGALLEILCQRQRILSMPLGAQAQRLDTQQQLLRSKRIQRGAQISQNLNPRPDNKGNIAKCLPELEPVITLRRLHKLRESLAVLAPVKLARVDNHTSNSGAMPADPLGGRVHDDVGAMVNRTDEVAACAKGVVHNERDARVVGDFGNGLEVGDVVARVADALDVHGLGVVVDGGGNVLGLVAVDEFGLDAQPGEKYFELVVGAAVEVGG